MTIRSPVLRVHTGDGIYVDNFAGGGGTSVGIEWATGRSPDVAINHDPEAIAMHQANHPNTHHVLGDVWDVKPRHLCKGRHVALAWFSPDCTFHSKARGSKPFRDPKAAEGRRGLAWVVIRWANDVHPDVIILENVEEFEDWGPIDPETKRPDPARAGLTFKRWLGCLRSAGYEVEMRQLRACDYGAPTTRKRLFIVARCDGKPIVWPEPTHGPGTPRPYRIAAECIQWEIPTVSIFATKKEAREYGVQRPLAKNTLRRIARGIQKFVVEAERPFIVPTSMGPIGATLIQTGYGERPGQAPRVPGLHKPLGTIIAGGTGGNGKHALVAAFLAKHYGSPERRRGGGVVIGQPIDRAIGTITAVDHHALMATELGRGDPAGIERVRAFLVKYYGTGTAQGANEPLDTITTNDRFGLVNVAGEAFDITNIGMRMLVRRELFRAQGFPDSYKIDVECNGKLLTDRSQKRMCGNSVSPYMAEALVAANVVGARRRAVA